MLGMTAALALGCALAGCGSDQSPCASEMTSSSAQQL